jgi:energy-coupling factor transport system permease protein
MSFASSSTGSRDRTGESRRALAFSTRHTAVAVICFAAIIGITMFAVHPVYAAISLAGALLFSFVARGLTPTLAGLRWELPLAALVALVNPLFSASGSTLIVRWGPVSIHLESLAFGATMGVLMVAVIVWFEDAAAVLTQDRLLSLCGRHARTIPLVTSIAAQLAGQLVARSRTVRAVSAACTAAGGGSDDGGGHDERAGLVRTTTMLLDWSLAESLGRSDAMRARGWESGHVRTSYRLERFRGSDAVCAGALSALFALSATLAWVACSRWGFFPTMPRLSFWWGYVPFALLVLVPAAEELACRHAERSLP